MAKNTDFYQVAKHSKFNNFVIGIEQSCDKESFENIGEAKIVTY